MAPCPVFTVRTFGRSLLPAERVADAAGDSGLRKTAREASRALRRGVVAYSSLAD